MVLDRPDSRNLAFGWINQLIREVQLYEALKTIHVLAAVIWVGGAVAIHVLVYKAARAQDTERAAALGQDAEYLGQRVFFPAAVVILVFGIWMVIDQPAWAFGQFWILFGLMISILSAAVGMAYYGPEASGSDGWRPSAASATRSSKPA
jgi:uncharacterized membrane protein